MNRRYQRGLASGHTSWCAGGHRCGLGEHRSQPITIRIPEAGSAVLTRVRSTSGHDYAELRVNVRLDPDEPTARTQLGHAIDTMHHLLTRTSTTS